MVQQLEPGVLPEDIIKDPYVLEFAPLIPEFPDLNDYIHQKSFTGFMPGKFH
jgi:hypothetical protein